VINKYKTQANNLTLETSQQPSFLNGLTAQQLNSYQFLLYKHHLTTLFTSMQQNNIPFLVLKGWSFIPDLYPDPGTRPFGDVDILIHPEEFGKTTTVLTALGFTAKNSPSGHIPLEITFSHPAGVHIDLHTHILTLAWWHTAFPIDRQTIWRSAQPYQDSTGLELQCLSPEVTFLHLCLHLFNHGIFNPRFHSYVDLVLLIRKYGTSMQWDQILQLTKDWHMLNIVDWVSQVLRRDFQTSLPIQIVRAGLVPALHPNTIQQRFIRSQFTASDKASAQRPSPWRSAFLLRLALIDNPSILSKLLFTSIFPNATLRTAIHNQPCNLLQHWQTYTRRLLQ